MIDYKDIAQKSNASQDWFELWQLLELLATIRPEKILEVGVHRGGMLETLHQAFPDAALFGIESDPSFLQFKDFNLITADSHNPATRDLFSTVGQFDFIFIDGDHTYDGAMQDWELYGPLCRPGGLVGFHDIMRDPINVPHHAGVDCRRVFDELKLHRANIEIWNGAIGMDAPGIGVLFV